MKQIALVGIVALACIAVWRIGAQLSSDAISMAVGVLFGVLAGVPTAIMVLASSRRRDPGRDRDDDEAEWQRQRRGGPYGGYLQQPPVIVVAGAPQAGQVQSMTGQRYLPQPHDISVDAREFKVVGETDGWVDEW